MSIRTPQTYTKLLLKISFGFLLFLILLVGIISLYDMYKLSNLTKKMYRHPLTVSNAVRDIKINIIIIENSMKDALLVNNQVEFSNAVNRINHSEKKIQSLFLVVYDRFLGRMEDIEIAEKSFQEWKSTREQILRLIKEKKIETALEIMKGRNAAYVETMHKKIQNMVNFANHKGNRFYQESRHAKKRAIYTFSLIIFFILLLSSTIALAVSKNILRLEKKIIIQADSLKEINQKLEKAKTDTVENLEKEKELNKLRSYFISIASHQFRTPLTTIQSSVDIIQMLVEKSHNGIKTKLQNHLNKIFSEIKRLDDLMNDILILGRVDAEKTPYYPRQTDIQELLDSLIKQTRFPDQGEREASLFQEGEKYLLYIDPKLLHHAVSNILSNAFKYSTGEPIIHISYQENQVVITISDNGIGIPEEARKYIFTTFYRANNVIEYQGTGLGLAIAKEFIHKNKGTLDFISELNKGTKFYIRLPKVQG